jgi:hypothetical protein
MNETNEVDSDASSDFSDLDLDILNDNDDLKYAVDIQTIDTHNYDMNWYTCDEQVMNYLNQLHCIWTCTVSPKSPVVHAIGILVGQRIRTSLAKQYRQMMNQALLQYLNKDELISISSVEIIKCWKEISINLSLPQHLKVKIQDFLSTFSKMEQKYSLYDGLSWLQMWKNQAGKYSRMPNLPYFGSWSYHAWLLMMMVQENQCEQYWFLKSLWLTDYTLKNIIFPSLQKMDQEKNTSLQKFLKQKEKCWGQYANQITFVLWRSSLT